VKAVRLSQALHRLDGLALRLDTQHQARAQRAAVNNDCAGPAVTCEASLFTAGKFQHITENFEQTLAGLAQELGLLAIDSCFYYCFLRHLGRRLNLF
jgi:hypothetical protein